MCIFTFSSQQVVRLHALRSSSAGKSRFPEQESSLTRHGDLSSRVFERLCGHSWPDVMEMGTVVNVVQVMQRGCRFGEQDLVHGTRPKGHGSFSVQMVSSNDLMVSACSITVAYC